MTRVKQAADRCSSPCPHAPRITHETARPSGDSPARVWCPMHAPQAIIERKQLMKYTPPRLHSLSGRNTKGNCANGSAANAIADYCTIGSGIDNGGGYCSNGGGDADWCDTGTAAYDSFPNCYSGTGPNDTCEAGGGPV